MEKRDVQIYKTLQKMKDSYFILDFKSDWDGDNAAEVSPSIYNKAMLFLHLLLNYVPNVVTPEINPCRNSTIDLHFENNGYRLLVNIKDDSVSCYGCGPQKENEIKSRDLKTADIIDWVTKFLIQSYLQTPQAH